MTGFDLTGTYRARFKNSQLKAENNTLRTQLKEQAEYRRRTRCRDRRNQVRPIIQKLDDRKKQLQDLEDQLRATSHAKLWEYSRYDLMNFSGIYKEDALDLDWLTPSIHEFEKKLAEAAKERSSAIVNDPMSATLTDHDSFADGYAKRECLLAFGELIQTKNHIAALVSFHPNQATRFRVNQAI